MIIYPQKNLLQIKQSFKPNVLLTVHWDGKLIPNCITKQKEDRLPILVTGDGVSKLLAVPALASGKSALEAEAIVNAISDWELEDKVIAMCFDTTNTNSGIHKGVITRLPKMLNKKLLALACRHHVAEIVLRHLFEVYGDNSQSDQLDGFKKFKTDYNKKLESGEIMIPKTVTDDAKLDALTAPWRNGIIDFCLQQIELKHPRSDYLELLELALSFLGFKSTSIKLRKAGSLSRARWLGRAIYVLKSWMLQSYFDLFDEDLIAHYEKLSIFICKVYVQYWFSLNDPVS